MGDLVIVHVWESLAIPGRSNFDPNDHGHSSIEIPSFNAYLSFWPKSSGGVAKNAAATLTLR